MSNKKYQKNYTNKLLENLRKGKVHSSIMDNIWCLDFTDMQMISIENGLKFLLCVIDI